MQKTPVADRHIEAARSEARADALREIDTFADWLSGACYLVPAQRLQPALRDKTAEDFTSWTIPALMALLLDAGQPVQTTIAARDALASRFCATPAVNLAIEQQAHERVGEIAEDEAADMRVAA
jgi:hypothetical protein